MKDNQPRKCLPPLQSPIFFRTALQPPPPTPRTRITHGLRPPSGMRGWTDDCRVCEEEDGDDDDGRRGRREAGKSRALRKPKNVPRPSARRCGNREVTKSPPDEWRLFFL